MRLDPFLLGNPIHSLLAWRKSNGLSGTCVWRSPHWWGAFPSKLASQHLLAPLLPHRSLHHTSQAYLVLSTKDRRIAAAWSSGDSLPLLFTLCCDVSRTHLVMWLPCWKRCRALHYVQNKIQILSFLFQDWRNRAGVQFLFLSAPP